MHKSAPREGHEREELVVSKALSKAASYWKVNNKALAEIVGLSEASVSRLKEAQFVLKSDSKPWQLALMFLRVFRGLDAYMGGQVEQEKAWLNAPNTALGGVPLELMRQPEGLANVVQYVDYIRGQ